MDMDIENKDIFRINMCIIHALFKNMVKLIAAEYNAVNVKNLNSKYLYSILHTSREDFSRYKNGQYTKPRPVMKDALVKELKEFDKFLSGEKLIETGEINNSWAKKHIDTNAKELVLLCQTETLTVAKNAIKMNKKAFQKDVSDDVDMVLYWMVENVTRLWSRISGPNRKIISVIDLLSKISFRDLDECDYEILVNTHSMIQSKYADYRKIYEYRMLKESKKKGLKIKINTEQ